MVGDLVALESGPDGWCDLFTDGSCRFSSDPRKRIAAFAILQAGYSGDMRDAKLIGPASVPGLLQSAFRAELWALVLAVESGVACGVRIRLWTDSLSAVKAVNKFLQLGKRRGVNGTNSDLWIRLFRAISQLGNERFSITHVYAHCLVLHEDLVDDWIVQHNAAVDKAAVVANVCRGDGFDELFSHHCAQVDVARRISRTVQRGLLAVGQAAFRSHVERSQSTGVTVDEVPSQDHTDEPFVLVVTDSIPPDLVQRYGYDYVSLLHGWLAGAMTVVQAEQTPATWVSSYQLFLDWVLSTGHCGIRSVAGRWETQGSARDQMIGFCLKNPNEVVVEVFC